MIDDRRQAFVERYGGIYEHSPWVANLAWERGPDAADDELAALLAECVDSASRQRKLQLIRAHPDLAGRAAVAGDLTSSSTAEQASAGLDRCTPEEYEQLNLLNERYREKFGFPFVMAVTGSSPGQVIRAFERRLANDREAEFETAISEIHKIARLRLEAL